MDARPEVTAPLRRVHFFSWIVVSAAAILILLAGVATRRPAPPNNPSIEWDRLK